MQLANHDYMYTYVAENNYLVRKETCSNKSNFGRTLIILIHTDNPSIVEIMSPSDVNLKLAADRAFNRLTTSFPLF